MQIIERAGGELLIARLPTALWGERSADVRLSQARYV